MGNPNLTSRCVAERMMGMLKVYPFEFGGEQVTCAEGQMMSPNHPGKVLANFEVVYSDGSRFSVRVVKEGGTVG